VTLGDVEMAKNIFYGFLIAAVLQLSSCATNPVSGRSDFVMVSQQQEIAMGKQAHPDIIKQYGGVYRNKSLQDYVQNVGDELVKNSHRSQLPFTFTVLDTDVINAFALPGGYVYISRGLMAYLGSEAELAAVLGHEIGHVTARHSVRQISGSRVADIGFKIGAILLPELQSQTAQGLFNVLGRAISSGYGRDYELEADRLGASYLKRSGYDPQAMMQVITVLKNQEQFDKQRAEAEGREPNSYHGVFATHPKNDKRLKEVIESVGDSSKDNVKVNQQQYLKQLDGMVFGKNSNDGIVHNNTFYHADLGIAVSFPENWDIKNLADRVIASEKNNQASIQLLTLELDEYVSAQEFIEENKALKNLSDEKEINIEGIKGYSAIATIKTEYGKQRARIVVMQIVRQAYIFIGAAKKEDDLTSFDELIIETARSLHKLTTAENKQAGALHIALIKNNTKTFKSLSEHSALTDYAEETLRLLNGMYPEGEPLKGQWLKVIE